MGNKACVFAAIALFGIFVSGKAISQDVPLLSPNAMEQLVIANKLAALGEERKDPLLLLAAVRLRQGLSDDGVDNAAEGTGTEALLKKAKEISGGDAALNEIADSVSGMTARGCSVRYGCQNPYIK